MAALTYTVVAIDVTRWGTLTAIKANLEVNAFKQIATAIDPLLDNSLINPANAYTVT